MILCFMDPTVPEDSQCRKCCIHCNEENCEQRCELSVQEKTEENILKADCPDAYEI